MSYTYNNPHPAVTVDCVVITKNREVLLVKRKYEPEKDCWAFPGGFMNIDETAETACLRELAEETGLHLDEADIYQIGAYTAVERDPRERVITIAYLAEVPHSFDVKGADDAAQAQWFPLDEHPQLAFDHAEILSDALLILEGDE